MKAQSTENIQKPARRSYPTVEAYTVQCARCFKWRDIPSIHDYEIIRENILKCPFFCETLQGSRPGISCADIPRITWGLWVIDTPNIPVPPPGWQRILKIRRNRKVRFADVYYFPPSVEKERAKEKLRSKRGVARFLEEHPEYKNQGIDLSQFSFKIPKPLCIPTEDCKRIVVSLSSQGIDSRRRPRVKRKHPNYPLEILCQPLKKRFR